MINNYCVIMAGGVGSRFWPFSTNDRPKQFLDFMGTGRSLLQMTYARLDGIVPKENVYIVTNMAYRDAILEQLPEMREEQILLEPMRRNTAPCIAYASYHIRKRDPKARVIVLPSDHLIADEREFRRCVTEGLEFVGENDALLTMGMKPTRPETGYGYIQMGQGEGVLRKVKTFTEKPDAEMAAVFIATGEFYWNSGMFMWRVDVILDQFRRLLPEVTEWFDSVDRELGTADEREAIERIYPQCQNISIDYGVMEKADNVYVMLADFGWSDLGTWSSLYELTAKDDKSNAVVRGRALFYEANDNVVAIGGDDIAVIDGLDGYLVAKDHGVLLICRKDEEARIRQYVKDVEERFGEDYV